MVDSVRSAVRERLRPGFVLFWAAVLAVLFWSLDETAVQLGITLVLAVVFGLLSLLVDVYDLRSSVETFGTSLVAFLGGLGVAVAGNGSGAPLVLAPTSAWMALDAGQTLRHEGWRDTDDHDDRDGYDVYREYVVRQVDSELRERALTRRELGTELDADEAAIDHALDVLAERGLLSRTGSELRVSSPPEPDTLARVRSGIVAPLARLARPLTIEFDDENADEDEDTHSPLAAKPVGEDGREHERESA